MERKASGLKIDVEQTWSPIAFKNCVKILRVPMAFFCLFLDLPTLKNKINTSRRS